MITRIRPFLFFEKKLSFIHQQGKELQQKRVKEARKKQAYGGSGESKEWDSGGMVPFKT